MHPERGADGLAVLVRSDLQPVEGDLVEHVGYHLQFQRKGARVDAGDLREQGGNRGDSGARSPVGSEGGLNRRGTVGRLQVALGDIQGAEQVSVSGSEVNDVGIRGRLGERHGASYGCPPVPRGQVARTGGAGKRLRLPVG